MGEDPCTRLHPSIASFTMLVDEIRESETNRLGPVRILRGEVERKNKLHKKVKSIRHALQAILLSAPFIVHASSIFGIQGVLSTLAAIGGALKIGNGRMDQANIEIDKNTKMLGKMFSSLLVFERGELKDALMIKEHRQLVLIAMDHVLSPDYWLSKTL